MKRRFSYHLNTLFFIAPWLFVFFTFSLYPIGYSLYLSFHKYRASGVAAPSWKGFGNYTKLLGDDKFLNALKNSAVFVLGTVPLTLIIALVLAIILNRALRFRAFYRVSFFMPTVTSLFVIATLFLELYAPTGFLNGLLGVFGIEGRHWLRDPDYALYAIMAMNIWASFGFYTLLLLAGLQNIPKEYYEASALDGASILRTFWSITLPLIKPTLLVALLINSILAFQIFGEIYIMTKGGPLRSTESAVYFLYNQGFAKQKMGYAAAAAYIIFLCLIAFSLLQVVAMGKNRGQQY